MIVDYVKATMLFVMGLIAIVVVIPVTIELVPSLKQSFSPTVLLMVGALIVVLVIALIYSYYANATGEQAQQGGF